MMLDHSSASPHYLGPEDGEVHVKTKKLPTKLIAHRAEKNVIEQLYNCLKFSNMSSDIAKADGFPTFLN